jgi:hypothetical protein
MTRSDGFVRTLVFGALAALALPAIWLVLGPALGARLALGLILVATCVAYLIALAPDRRAALAAGVAAAVLGAGVLALAATRGELAFGAAAVLAVCRAGILGRARSPLRAIAAESALAGGGLALAALLAGPGPLGAALGLWTFFLVQSVWHLVGDARPRAAAGRDPFDAAHARLRSLLDEEPV